jgi:hypothetical protein
MDSQDGVLHKASLVMHRSIDALCPRACVYTPGTPATAFPRICINASFTVVAISLADRINPSRSADNGTCRLLSQMLQSWPSFTAAISLDTPSSSPLPLSPLPFWVLLPCHLDPHRWLGSVSFSIRPALHSSVTWEFTGPLPACMYARTVFKLP